MSHFRNFALAIINSSPCAAAWNKLFGISRPYQNQRSACHFCEFLHYWYHYWRILEITSQSCTCILQRCTSWNCKPHWNGSDEELELETFVGEIVDRKYLFHLHQPEPSSNLHHLRRSHRIQETFWTQVTITQVNLGSLFFSF